MSKVAISGNASGTGTFTIQAPNSNTDRVLSLPDEAGTVLTSASSIPVANLDSAVGITGADIWRLSTNYTTPNGNSYTIDNFWERADDATFAHVGTGMTQSSGIFTFPTTGIWYVSFTYGCYKSSAERYLGIIMQASSDSGSNWDDLTENLSSVHNAGVNAYQTGTSNVFIDVTDASQFRMRFITVSGSAISYDGSTGQNRTYATFIRLGDT